MSAAGRALSSLRLFAASSPKKLSIGLHPRDAPGPKFSLWDKSPGRRPGGARAFISSAAAASRGPPLWSRAPEEEEEEEKPELGPAGPPSIHEPALGRCSLLPLPSAGQGPASEAASDPRMEKAHGIFTDDFGGFRRPRNEPLGYAGKSAAAAARES